MEVFTSWPAAFAAASLRPTPATCELVNTTHGMVPLFIGDAVAVQRIERALLGPIGRHVDQLVAVGPVARRIDARFRRAHTVIDDDSTAGVLHGAGIRQPDGLRVGGAPRGDQQPLRLELDRLTDFVDADGHARLVFTAGSAIIWASSAPT